MKKAKSLLRVSESVHIHILCCVDGAACLCTITDYSEHADAESRKALPEKSAGDAAAIYGNTGSKKQTAGRSSGSGRKSQYGKKQFFCPG